MDRSDGTGEFGRARSYHHGDLRNALLEAARSILEEQDLSELSLRAVARRAGVSHAAPYRHFPNHEALLVELAMEGFSELRQEIASAAASPMPSPIALRRSALPICASSLGGRRSPV